MDDDARPDGDDARSHVCPACRLPVPCGAVVFRGDDWYHLRCARRLGLLDTPAPATSDPPSDPGTDPAA
jgi:hypothetical protein